VNRICRCSRFVTGLHRLLVNHFEGHPKQNLGRKVCKSPQDLQSKATGRTACADRSVKRIYLIRDKIHPPFHMPQSAFGLSVGKLNCRINQRDTTASSVARSSQLARYLPIDPERRSQRCSRRDRDRTKNNTKKTAPFGAGLQSAPVVIRMDVRK